MPQLESPSDLGHFDNEVVDMALTSPQDTSDIALKNTLQAKED